MDIGCSWIHGYREGSVVRELTDELGVVSHTLDRVLADTDPLYFRNATFQTRAKVVWSLKAVRRSLTSRITFTQKIPSPDILDPTLAAKLSKNLAAALSAAATTTSTDTKTSLAASLLAPTSLLFGTLDSTSEHHLATSLARTLEIGMGVQLQDVSLSCFGYEDSAKGTDAAIVGGYDALIKKLADEVEMMGGEIRLSSKAQHIGPEETLEAKVSLDIVVENDIQRASSRLVISTIPLSLLQKNRSELFKALSTKKVHAIDKVHVGKLGKLVISYEDAW